MRTCAYELCQNDLPEGAHPSRLFCRESHRVSAHKRRQADELKRLRALLGAQTTAAS